MRARVFGAVITLAFRAGGHRENGELRSAFRFTQSPGRESDRGSHSRC
jgi:hypothetical protein